MLYRLNAISEEEFNRFHSLVRAVFDQGRQRFDGRLRTVTDDPTLFPKSEQEYLAQNKALGVTFKLRGEEFGTFHIWMNPAYAEPSFSFFNTLAHELCHGYAGVGYGHNAHWRRWYYRVMYHLWENGFISTPDEDPTDPDRYPGETLEIMCYAKGFQYNRIDSSQDELGLVREAFAKAKSDSDKVKENYFRRTLAQGANHI